MLATKAARSYSRADEKEREREGNVEGDEDRGNGVQFLLTSIFFF